MKNYYEFVTLLGEIADKSEAESSFSVKLLSQDILTIHTGVNTSFEVIKNLDNLECDRVSSPPRKDGENDIAYRFHKYVQTGLTVCIQGIFSSNSGVIRYDAKRVILMHWIPNRYAWEETHWWIAQVSRMCDQWLDVLFRNKRTFCPNDFADCYRSNLNILGGHTDDNIQECATLSRFLYGISSAYLMTGLDRFHSAAKAAAYYLSETFRSPSHDEHYVFWKFGRRDTINSSVDIIPSQNPDDFGTYALYEQIYALAGLAQYYRISQDQGILDIIRKTINSFRDYFFDAERPGDPCFRGKGGYFSHIDPVTMRPDAQALDRGGGYNNRMKKNWNSIGDHIPAYLINILLAIDPLPDEAPHWKELRTLCWKILDECVDNITTHFPRSDSLYVQERFDADWNPDTSWGWQQDRAIVGHNLKIAWNLTRCGHYYNYRAQIWLKEGSKAESDKQIERAKRCYAVAEDIGKKMVEVGVDQARGGIFDAVERKPQNGLPIEFSWGCTKDFWQQEQAILAYLILGGLNTQESALYQNCARACSAFWNLFFLDRDNSKIRFRTSESGEPIIDGAYAQQAGHAIAGYHAFELAYLAHFYTRCYMPKPNGADENFVMYFRPKCSSEVSAINAMPDFVRPGSVKITRVKINGEVVEGLVEDGYQIRLEHCPSDSVVAVEFQTLHQAQP